MAALVYEIAYPEPQRHAGSDSIS